MCPERTARNPYAFRARYSPCLTPRNKTIAPNTSADGNTIISVVSRVIGDIEAPPTPTAINATNATAVVSVSNSIIGTENCRDLKDQVSATPAASMAVDSTHSKNVRKRAAASSTRPVHSENRIHSSTVVPNAVPGIPATPASSISS